MQKKSFEAGVEINGEMTYKGSDAHKAAVTGDTVGDPFKDTSGPSMNILIKLTCLIGLVIAPILGGHSIDSDHASADLEVKKEVIVKADNDVWTMTVTTEETDSDGVSKKSEFISGTQEEIMEAMLEQNTSEVKKIGMAAMMQIEKK
jgi:K(+)-stimulated pyrophosphate-energized sodium pump